MDWRETQRNMFGGKELEQDARIKTFFALERKSNTFFYGDTDYFTDYFENHNTPYENVLCVINHDIEFSHLLRQLDGIVNKCGDVKKVCVAINKFCVYSDVADTDAHDVYDTALINAIIKKFNGFNVVNTITDNNLKGDKFNFASPFTQIYFTKQ